MKAPAFRSDRASRRAQRVAKRLSALPQPPASRPDPIDEQIASLLEIVTSEVETHAVAQPSARPARAASTNGSPTKVRAPRRRVRRSQMRTLGHPDRVSETVREAREAIVGVAIALPRPSMPYTVRMAFWWLAIALFSIAFGLLIIYLMSP